ncbi:hypothetical protein D9M72_551280 [compost metagenome]
MPPSATAVFSTALPWCSAPMAIFTGSSSPSAERRASSSRYSTTAASTSACEAKLRPARGAARPGRFSRWSGATCLATRASASASQWETLWAWGRITSWSRARNASGSVTASGRVRTRVA